MSLVNSVEVFPGEEINTICINPDNKLCYVWSSENIISTFLQYNRNNHLNIQLISI